MDGLPEYMQAYFKEFLQLYEYIGNQLAAKGRSYRLIYAKEVVRIIDKLHMHRRQSLVRNLKFLCMFNFSDEEASGSILSGSQMVPYQLYTNTRRVHAASTNNDWLWNVIDYITCRNGRCGHRTCS